MRNDLEVTFTSSDQYTMADGSEIYVFKYISNDGSNQSQYDLTINMTGTMDMLMVCGGGGGYGRGGGGGGAGGLVFYPALDLSTLNTVTLKEGNGGTATSGSGNNRADSEIIFNSQTIAAKGGGGSGYQTNGKNGGSGGGIKHYPDKPGGSSNQATGVTNVWVGYGNNGGTYINAMSGSGGGGAGT